MAVIPASFGRSAIHWTLFCNVLVMTLAASASAAEVTICHIPPGNPADQHTVTVGETAVQAHLDHGDHLGECSCDSGAPETACTDGDDNDCDGAVDGADDDCAVCGDGVVQDGEQCDDGNTNPFDGCDQCIIVDITPD
jgi:cysteine-rich repeat protein